MNPELENALASWEAGGLSRDELARRFPGEDVAGLLTAYERMQAAATGPTPDPAAVWDAIRPQLPVPLARRRVRSRGIRLLAAALIALLAMGATAYAFVPDVRRAIGAAFGSGTGPDVTAPVGPTRTDSETLSDDPARTLGSDDEATEDDEASTGTGERNDEGQDAGEDQDGSGQEQGEDEGNGSEQGSEADGGGSGEDQGTQGSGSEEGSGDGGGGSGGTDHDTEGPEQPQDGDSGN